jgi:ureidoacrylate peracid hydrolase
MTSANMGPDFDKCALIIVDMQNDFVHSDGSFSYMAREHPEAAIDLQFLMGTIPHVRRLADAFRGAGRPVVYVAHILKPDYSDAAFPYWANWDDARRRQPHALCRGDLGCADHR